MTEACSVQIIPIPQDESTIPTATVVESRECTIPQAEEEYDYMVNTISQQTKDQEMTYIPREWATPKLEQVKQASTLCVHTRILPNTIKISNNTISVTIETYLSKHSVLQFHFYQGGIVKLNCINPSNPSKFSIEMIEKPANLTPYHIDSNKVAVHPTSLEVQLDEFHMKYIVDFDPFTIKVLSTKNPEAPEALLEMNTHKSLVFDENLSADFTFHTEYLYGLPEHASDLLLQDTRSDLPYRFYNQDVPSFPVGSKNGLYATVPIIYSRKKNSSTFVSLYWQNTSDTYIDIHKLNQSSTTAYWLSERGNLECYILVNYSQAAHFKSFSDIFGHCAMPQYFSLGYHQCRWSYLDEKDVLQVNEGFNTNEIPCDSITLDIDHTEGCRYFTWNKKHFPEPEYMQERLHQDGRQLITIADPHIKVDESYSVYKEGAEKDLFIRTKENDVFVGKCWPGNSVWFDFLNEEAREYWASRYHFENYKHSTPNLWAWNDMNEPSVFEFKGNHMPLDHVQTFKSLADPENAFQVEHREVHNIYGYTQNKATFQGMLNRSEGKIRPHVLTRSFYAGSQKWTTVWTGDTSATWEYLKDTVPQLLSLSLCGISNCGGDVGGFIGDPEPELAVRWYQLGSYMPFFRGHSEITTKRREPWLFEKKYAEIIKDSIKQKYRMLPYWYTCFENHCKNNQPVLRPVWYDQEVIADEETMKEQERFMVGEGLLVVPVLEENRSTIKEVTKGLEGRWYDYHTKKEIVKGENDTIQIGLERIGCFVKGGKIIPTFDIKNTVKSSKDAKQSNIVLYVGLDKESKAEGAIYFDDGETFDFEKGVYQRNKISFEKNTLTWENTGEGADFTSRNKVTKVVLMGMDADVQSVSLVSSDDTKQKLNFTKTGNCVNVELVSPPVDQNWKIVLE